MTDIPTRCAWCGALHGAFLSLLSHIDEEHLVTPHNVISLAAARRDRLERRLRNQQRLLPTPA